MPRTDNQDSDGKSTQGEIIKAEGLTVRYGQVIALKNIDLDVSDSETVAIIGPNGAGKSTLADTILHLNEYDGRLQYRGQEVNELTTSDLVQRGISYCTESRDLFSYMSVEDNLKLGAFVDYTDLDQLLERAYDMFPVLEERKEQNAGTLSGGEQQMLAVARSLMSEPDFLILDEPTLGLAPKISQTINEALRDIIDSGVNVFLLEQNVQFALDLADRIYLLENGEFKREGEPTTLVEDEYVRDAYLGE